MQQSLEEIPESKVFKSIQKLAKLSNRQSVADVQSNATSKIQNFNAVFDKELTSTYNMTKDWQHLFVTTPNRIISVESGNPYISVQESGNMEARRRFYSFKREVKTASPVNSRISLQKTKKGEID